MRRCFGHQAAMRHSAVALAGIALLAAGCGSSSSSSGGARVEGNPNAKLVIGYATKSATNQGWLIINQGASDAAKGLGVKLITLGPPTANEISGQANVVENLVSKKVKTLVVAPVDSAGIVPAVNKATAARIPVVALDTAVEGAKVASFVATDNLAAATKQAEWTGKAIGGKGTVILVNGDLASSTGRERRDGFVKTIKASYPGVKVVEVATKWDQAEAQRGIESALSAHPDAVAIANAWDGGTLAAIQAAASRSKNDIKIVGFDGDQNALKAMLDGKVHADVAQLLYKMGHTAIETAVKVAKGQTVKQRIDPGSELVTPNNVEQFAADNHIDLK